MHEEATSMSVPSSVAASTTQNENGTTPTVSVVTAEVDLNVDNDNVDLQVPFSSNSGGNHSKHPQVNRAVHGEPVLETAARTDSLLSLQFRFLASDESEFEREIVACRVRLFRINVSGTGLPSASSSRPVLFCCTRLLTYVIRANRKTLT